MLSLHFSARECQYTFLMFHEDGCKVIPLSDSYGVVSGDGSGVNTDNVTEVAFEFKCPKTGKERVTDTHYKVPVYYVTQVLSQMAVKKM